MIKKDIKKIAHSYYNDRDKLLKNKKYKKVYDDELLKLKIASDIIALRKKKNISQSELAKKINTTQAVVSRIENAQVFPSTKLISKIALALDVQVKFEFV